MPVPGLCLLELGLALDAAGGLVAVEQREYLQVFGAACCFLGADHAVEVGDHDHDVCDADSVGACGQLGIAGAEAGRVLPRFVSYLAVLEPTTQTGIHRSLP